jgi:hypothetical protein
MPQLHLPNAKEHQMTIYSEESVLPRPVEPLPEYANARSRQALVERLIAAFKLSPESASAIANASVDPSAVRKAIGDPEDPEVEEIAVPGGTLLGIRTSVWARKVLPDPRNPRILPSRRHPFATDPGSGGEDSKFRPIPEPKSRNTERPEEAELSVDIESRHHLTWASQQAAQYILAENDWRASIASQGVMEAVWLVATTYEHRDQSATATTLTTVEGSSRLTAVHDLLGVRSADVPYDDQEGRLRALLKKLNERLVAGPTGDEQTALRCERIPALIIVGFRRHQSGNTGFPTAVKSMVALRHVDPPKPWGEGPENESLADEVLDELYRQNLIDATKRDYFAGSCTRAEAKAAHLSDDPAIRAAEIANLFISRDDRVGYAIRMAVTSQSTRKRITPKLSNDLATALILRAHVDDPAKTDQIRRYMRHAFGKAAHRDTWDCTARATEQLLAEALREVREAIGCESAPAPGPASLELAVRAAYPLVVSGRLNADRGSNNNEQPDRRTPGEVLDAMRQTTQGVFQLAQALKDYAASQPIRAVDEDGQPKRLSDNSGDQVVSDIYLRGEFPPHGKARAQRPGDTPLDHYRNRLGDFSRAVERLKQAFSAVTEVLGDDGRPLAETYGVDRRECDAWREEMSQIDEELIVWGRTFKRVNGLRSGPAERGFAPNDDGFVEEIDVYSEANPEEDEVNAG